MNKIINFIKSIIETDKPNNNSNYNYDVPVSTPTITAFVHTPDGDVLEMSKDTILTDGTCLIAENGKYYHTHVGCCYKWSDEAFNYFVDHGGYKLINIDEAKKQGLLLCLTCNDEIRQREKFDFEG